MAESISKIKESGCFVKIYPHPTPEHPLIKGNPKMTGVWIGEIKIENFSAAKKYLNREKIPFSVFNKKKSFFIWPLE